MLPDQTAEEIFALDHETRHVEWKTAGDLSEKRYLAKIARALIAMANTKGGGFIVIGIKESGGADRRNLSQSERMVGVSDVELPMWSHQGLADKLQEYMQPPAIFECHQVTRAGKSFVVVEVEEFADQPLICTRESQAQDGEKITQRGACYIRSRANVRSVPIGTYEEMRDLLDLAIDKGLRSFLERTQRVGLLAEKGPSDLEKFQAERGGLW